MEQKTEKNHIQNLISDAMVMSQGQFDPEQLPHFDEIAKECRKNNHIAEEIKVLKIAISFYENSDIDDGKCEAELGKFKAWLNARQKEAKVLEVLGW